MWRAAILALMLVSAGCEQKQTERKRVTAEEAANSAQTGGGESSTAIEANAAAPDANVPVAGGSSAGGADANSGSQGAGSGTAAGVGAKGDPNCRLCRASGLVPCETCDRTGLDKCAKCRGYGNVTCPTCNGNWRRDPCPQCGGTGKKEVTRRLPNNTIARDIVACVFTWAGGTKSCGGKGYGWFCPKCSNNDVRGKGICETCKGTMRSGPCPKCRGASKVSCPNCVASK